MRRPRAVALGTLLAFGFVATGAQAAPELSVTERLKDRRYVAAGERAYAVGFEDGRWYAQGWHITGEMGGVWSQPLKLVDGVWFGIDDQWIGPATGFTSGWGYVKMDLPETAGLKLTRTEFAPDDQRAYLIELTLENAGTADKTVTLRADVHSEVMQHYPWAWTTPNSGAYNLQDTGAFDDRALIFRDAGTPPVPNAEAHDWAAMVAADATPTGHELGAIAGRRIPP